MAEPPAASPSTPVTPDEVRALREQMGHTVDHFAATLGVGSGEVRGWEAGTLRVPRYEGAWMRRMLAAEARSRAAAEAGITDCAWIVAREEAFLAEREKEGARAVQRMRGEVEQHARDCADCRRVREWVQTQPPLPPAPTPGGVRGLAAEFVGWARTLPPWLRPPVYGAALGGVMMVVRAALLLLLRVPTPAVLGGLPLALAVGVALGALAGVTWMLVHRPLRRLGKAAPYVTGTVIAVVCTLAFLAPGTLRGDARLAADGLRLLLVTVVGGLLLGHALLRHVGDGEDTRSDESPGLRDNV